MLRNRIAFLLVILITISSSFCFAQKNILVYTHNGEGFVHKNIAASVEALKKLGKENDYKMTVTDDPAIFSAKSLKKYQCIIFSNTNNEAFYTDVQKQAFVDYIHRGGGFVGIHSACGSERKWPWFTAMIGARFYRHPKLQPFTIKVIDKNHPSTSFMNDSWQWEDECYLNTHLNPDIHVLLAADLNTIKDDKKDEYPGKVFGNLFPLAWYHEFEGGRQFYTALGHKNEHYKDPLFLKHLLGGIKWALNEE